MGQIILENVQLKKDNSKSQGKGRRTTNWTIVGSPVLGDHNTGILLGLMLTKLSDLKKIYFIY
jgi:hypothetical protein